MGLKIPSFGASAEVKAARAQLDKTLNDRNDVHNDPVGIKQALFGNETGRVTVMNIGSDEARLIAADIGMLDPAMAKRVLTELDHRLQDIDKSKLTITK